MPGTLPGHEAMDSVWPMWPFAREEVADEGNSLVKVATCRPASLEEWWGTGDHDALPLARWRDLGQQPVCHT